MASKIKRQRLVFSEKLMYSFINDYKESGCLWDIKNPDYKCAEKRRAALSRLAVKYDVSEEEAKKKINSLRSTYLQEKKKVEESKRVNGGDVYEPSLYWYHELEFLYDVIIPRKTPHPCNSYGSSSSPPEPQTPDHCQNEVVNQEVDQEHLIFEFVPDGDEKTIFAQKLEPAPYISQPTGVINNGRRLAKRRPVRKPPQPPNHPHIVEHHQHIGDHHQHISEPIEVQSQRVQPHERPCQSPPPTTNVQHEDEFDTFCCSIASQLRTLPQTDAIEMQLEIQQLVSRRRLAVLKSHQNLSLFRTWESSDGYHQYHSHPPSMENGNGQEERNEKLVLGQ